MRDWKKAEQTRIKRKSKRFSIFMILAIIWMAVIYSFSSKDGEESSNQSGCIVEAVQEILDVEFKEEETDTFTFIVRKMAHFTEYAILGILYMGMIYELVKTKIFMVIFSTFACMIYAITDEIHQGFVGGRSPQITDVMIDTTGGVIGGMICLTALIWIAKKNQMEVNK